MNFDWPFIGTMSITTDRREKCFMAESEKEISNTKLNSERQIHSVMILRIIQTNMSALVPAQTVFLIEER